MPVPSILKNATVAIRSRTVGVQQQMPVVTWRALVRKMPLLTRVLWADFSAANATEACGGSNRLTLFNTTIPLGPVGPFVNPGVNGFRGLGCYRYLPYFSYPRGLLDSDKRGSILVRS